MIYYLVQGEAYQYPDRIAEMANSGAEVIFLTWDKKIDGALFLPNSTWAQGRNFLLQYVLKNNYNFEYLVFIDGDAKPIKGSWCEFNNFLLNKKPQVCIPLMPKSRNTNLLHLIKILHLPLQIPRQQRALSIDEQVQAFRNDVILAIGTYIYPTLFDNICWSYNAKVSQQILRYLIPHNIIQFNSLDIENNSHLSYPDSYNDSFIVDYLQKSRLYFIFPLFNFRNFSNNFVCKLIILLNAFIELLYWIPFPIKEFNLTKRAKYVKQCLQKMKTIDIPKSKKNEDCTNI